METRIGEEVEKYGPNIVVTPRTQSVTVPYGSVVVGNVTIPESYVEEIYTIPNKRNIRVLSPKIFGQVPYENGSLLIVGINASRETELKNWWNVSGYLPRDNTTEAIVGSTVQTSLGLTVGSTIQLQNTTYSVVGYLSETGSTDDYSVFLPLASAQALLKRVGEISLIDVGALCKDCPVEVISQQIVDVLPDVKATPVKQAVETRMKTVEQTANFSLLLASIILVVGCAGVMNTMLSSVHERTKEIGILMSLGADNNHLYKLFLIESAILGLIGGLAGTIVGLASSALFGQLFVGIPIDLTETPMYIFPLVVLLSIAACLIASLYPTWRASKIDPVTALRTV